MADHLRTSCISGARLSCFYSQGDMYSNGEFLINDGESEDCLDLNIYAPLAPVAPTSSKLPVFVYIPGGGFTSGGSNSLYKIPD